MKTIYAIVFITLINFFLASYLFCQATQEWVAIYNGNYDDHSPYLALDEIYHPFRVAIPNNSTLRGRVVRGGLRVGDGVLTLCDRPFQTVLLT